MFAGNRVKIFFVDTVDLATSATMHTTTKNPKVSMSCAQNFFVELANTAIDARLYMIRQTCTLTTTTTTTVAVAAAAAAAVVVVAMVRTLRACSER